MLEQRDYKSYDNNPLPGVLRGVELALRGVEGATVYRPHAESTAAVYAGLPTNTPAANMASVVEIPLGRDVECYQFGFQSAVQAVVGALASGGRKLKAVNILPGIVSPADVRTLKEIVTSFGVSTTALPDISIRQAQAADALPGHGASPADIARMGRAWATLEFGRIRYISCTAGQLLREKFRIPWYRLPWPIGMASTDKLFKVLEKLTERPAPKEYRQARYQLGEAYRLDRSKLAGRRAVIYGEDTAVAALTAFLYEIEMEPVLCASEGKSGQLAEIVHYVAPDMFAPTTVLEGVELSRVVSLIKRLEPQLLLGSPALRPLAYELGLPFIQAGLPFIEEQPSYFGYAGSLAFFERVLDVLQ